MKFVIIVIVVILLIYIISKRNSFNELRRSIKHQESSIGIQIEKRSRCLHDAMNIAKLACSHEVGGMERLTARDQLNQLAYLGEKYPSLSSQPQKGGLFGGDPQGLRCGGQGCGRVAAGAGPGQVSAFPQIALPAHFLYLTSPDPSS